MRPRLLDLFCGAGGAAVGYSRAGFDVVGVDNVHQKNYPFEFIQMDALEACRDFGGEFDLIHASPPCQAFSRITPDKSKHTDLIPDTREVLIASGKPYVIENVMGAVRALRAPIILCGMVFDLKVYRHRAFESNFLLLSPPHWPHRDNTPRAGHGTSDKGFISITSGGNPVDRRFGRTSGTPGVSSKGFVSVTGHFTGADYCRMAMGIDWMTGEELSQAIPPAYTEYIGKQLLAILRRVKVTQA